VLGVSAGTVAARADRARIAVAAAHARAAVPAVC
jgi:hypothetical protein